MKLETIFFIVGIIGILFGILMILKIRGNIHHCKYCKRYTVFRMGKFIPGNKHYEICNDCNTGRIFKN